MRFFPLDNTQSTFTVVYNLWQTLTPTPARVTTSVTGNLTAYTWWNTTVSSGIVASAEVVPLQRLPVVLVNMTGELENLSGYGYRYTGEQRFYSFDLNINGTAPQYPHSPFATGSSPVLNTLLISRASYLSTNFSADLNAGKLQANHSAVFWCLNGAQMSVRGGYTSQLGISGSLSASMNDTCANMLLQQLAIYNSTGNLTSSFQALNTTGIALLGLQVQDGQLAVFLPLAGFNSGQGTENISSYIPHRLNGQSLNYPSPL
jgi:hypothetical protein